MIEIDLNSIAKHPKLPFIYLPELDLKILIDSGASNSVINRTPAFEKFAAYLFKKPFALTGLTRTIQANDNIWFPLFYELGIDDFIHIHVVDWHKRFDALVGSDDLKKLGAIIDYSSNTLKIGNLEIPFLFEYNSPTVTPQPVSVHNVIKIPVTIESGDVLFPETSITPHVSIPESITTACDGYCLFPLEQDINIDVCFTERIPVTPLWHIEMQNPPNLNEKANISNLLRTTHLNVEEKHAITDLCKKYHDIFYNEHSDLSFSNTVKHHIRTTDDTPVYVKPFRHPYFMRNEIQSQIQKLLDNKIIRPSVSPYSSPVWVVPKKADASGKKKFRLVIDYRKLNEKTIEDKYPIPRIEEILDNLGKCSYFTTLDLAQGFHQIEMDPGSIEKTAFSVHTGHYEYLRMPFGLKNAPSSFQRVMDNVFREFNNKFLFVYMDDIFVFSKSLNEHLQHLSSVFKKIRSYNLKIQLDKSEFLRKEVEFLGHLITPQGIKPNPSKISAIENFPVPRTTKEIKSFLGLVGYYRRFISNFAHIVAPLTKCLRKGSKININDTDFIHSFHKCKEVLTNSPVLAYPDFFKPFKLTTDASNVALGSVLTQGNHPIAFYSRTLNSAERNYSTIEKELLAILDSVKHFRPYLFGKKFTVETDHNALTWLYKIKEPNSKLIRWKLKLEEFDFDIIHKKGKENAVADALSRVEINNQEDNENDNISTSPNIDELPDLSDLDNYLHADIVNELLNDAESAVNANPDQIAPQLENETIETIHSTNDDNGKCIPITERSVNSFKNRIIFKLGDCNKSKFTKPFNRPTHIVTLSSDNIENNLAPLIRDIFVPSSVYCVYFVNDEIRQPFLNFCKTTFNSFIKIFISNIYCKDVIDVDSQNDIIGEYHDSNHNGITETVNHFRTKFFWPNLKDTVTRIINNCETCLKSKYERHPYNPKFSGPLLAKRPFETLHIDTFSFQSSKFLTIIDLFSRYAQAYLIKDGTSLSVLSKLRHFFAHHNVPQKIVCDSGKEFQNRTFSEFCKLNKIELHYTTVNNPNSNSPVERLHSTLIEKLRTLQIKNPRELPSNLMISAILIYNQSIHSSTGYSPFDLLYGPYERLIEFDLDMTVFETYNQKRKQEILPFYDQVYSKNKSKAEGILAKRNLNRDDPPDFSNLNVYIERNRPRKIDPPFEKLTITNQDDTKLTGITTKGRSTTANVRKVKRLRKIVSSLQDMDSPADPQPGPSGLAN